MYLNDKSKGKRVMISKESWQRQEEKQQGQVFNGTRTAVIMRGVKPVSDDHQMTNVGCKSVYTGNGASKVIDNVGAEDFFGDAKFDDAADCEINMERFGLCASANDGDDGMISFTCPRCLCRFRVDRDDDLQGLMTCSDYKFCGHDFVVVKR